MHRRSWSPAAAVLAIVACGNAAGGGDATAEVPAANVDPGVCAPENGPFSTTIDNPYFPLTVGAVHVLEGLEGGTQKGRYQLTVPNETVAIAGVVTRVVEKRHALEGDPPDPERAYFAQAPDGTVCIFGEEGAWQAGKEGYVPGIFMPGAPAVGMVFVMVHGPDSVETGEITHVGVPTVTPAGTFPDTVVVLEDGPSIKKYARGVGEIYDDGLELISY